jgi:polyphenol oxidase
MALPFNRLIRKNQLVLLEFENLAQYRPKVIHAFTTREGGYSKGVFKGLNLGFLTEDFNGNVLKNHALLAKTVGFDLEDTVFSHQVHGTDVRVVTQKDLRKGGQLEEISVAFDGMVCREKNVILMSFFADCVPLFFYDPKKEAIGLAHAGWKGSLNGIGARMVEVLGKEFGCHPEDIEVTLGPSIGDCCFEVGQEVYALFKQAYPKPEYYQHKTDTTVHIHLGEILKESLKTVGMTEKNIYQSGICTKCSNELFFSHRAQNNKAGRMVGLIGLKEADAS